MRPLGSLLAGWTGLVSLAWGGPVVGLSPQDNSNAPLWRHAAILAVEAGPISPPYQRVWPEEPAGPGARGAQCVSFNLESTAVATLCIPLSGDGPRLLYDPSFSLTVRFPATGLARGGGEVQEAVLEAAAGRANALYTAGWGMLMVLGPLGVRRARRRPRDASVVRRRGPPGTFLLVEVSARGAVRLRGLFRVAADAIAIAHHRERQRWRGLAPSSRRLFAVTDGPLEAGKIIYLTPRLRAAVARLASKGHAPVRMEEAAVLALRMKRRREVMRAIA